jgi:hypothetical protein
LYPIQVPILRAWIQVRETSLPIAPAGHISGHAHNTWSLGWRWRSIRADRAPPPPIPSAQVLNGQHTGSLGHLRCEFSRTPINAPKSLVRRQPMPSIPAYTFINLTRSPATSSPGAGLSRILSIMTQDERRKWSTREYKLHSAS